MAVQYGYIRVSSAEQNEARQVIAMREAGLDGNHIYMDKQSGKDFDRPQYQRVHNVDRACISVLSQVIRNVNEKKNRTDKYDFLREPWRWDSKNFVKLLLHKIFAQKSIGMPGEQEYHICLYDFSFSSTLIKTCERTLISALHTLKTHDKICDTTLVKLRL